MQYAFSFPANYDFLQCVNRQKVFVGSRVNSASHSSCVHVKVSFPLMPNVTDITFDLSPSGIGSSKTFALPDELHEEKLKITYGEGKVTNKTVLVAASEDVIVYGFHGCSLSKGKVAASFRAKKIHSRGNEYWVFSDLVMRQSWVTITAFENKTIISLNPVRIGSPINVTLSLYESFLWSLERDFLGVKVTSNHNVTLLVGQDRTLIPLKSVNADPFMECLDPDTDWGKTYLLSNLLDPSLSGGYDVRILSIVNTTVTLKIPTGHIDEDRTSPSGVTELHIGLQAGEYFQGVIQANSSDPVEIFSVVPLLVAQFTHKTDHSSPSMVQVPSLDHPLVKDKVIFPVFDLTAVENGTYYLTVYIPPEAEAADLYLDDVNDLDWQFIAAVSSGWRVLQTTLPTGSHLLEVKGNYSINAIVFAHEHLRSYAYSIA